MLPVRQTGKYFFRRGDGRLRRRNGTALCASPDQEHVLGSDSQCTSSDKPYVKLGWALGQTDDLDRVKEIMLTPICGEITEREPHDGYLIFQGGMPELEAFLKRIHK